MSKKEIAGEKTGAVRTGPAKMGAGHNDMEKSSAEQIDIEEIMQVIRRDAAAREYPKDVLSFEEFKLVQAAGVGTDAGGSLSVDGEAARLQAELEAACTVDYQYPILDGGVRGFFKKALRRVLRNVIWPLVNQQNEINRKMTDYFRVLAASGGAAGKDVSEKKSGSPEEKISELKSENDALRARIEELERTVRRVSEEKGAGKE